MANITRNDRAGRYELRDKSGEVLGFAEFQAVGDTVLLPHTVVEPGHGGEGLGSQLARYALDDIRAQGKKVVPACAFIAGFIDKHPEYTDLVAD